ncbi:MULTISPECIES: endonuclease [Mesonia]|uniref:Extracellular ribonuclease n=1 Tax=Mesonia oceanica TaxID=2687242 RepID=A0AC61YC63_9FLAO|nr:MULTISPECIES: endonuclease [Mesonia]MAN29189.1 endonuclease I [Mesonia sp.]MAQ39987.1 endonuclease I [Mesonia sp.]MBJ99120.1 endonuclease I [Flavobacteriaceae bacterium]VVV01968.1 Extracellular ribonuclease [Mesonia oceanica]|tara:strand:- start:111452 stop:113413 length:1962 start_codon:yes stop_codon:yes gene_type:complete
MKNIFTPLLLLFFISLNAQVVINELDSDTDGIDDLEFIELKTDNPYASLNGYVLVFFNGSSSGNDSSYYAIDLDGFTSDINGLFVIGNMGVSPVPQYFISDNTIQNGADAVAIYQGDDTDFPEGTQATTNNLIDALVYDTNDADDIGLMNLLGVSVQINEDENNNKDFESIQRNNDGTYFVGAPTPRLLNDGSGVILNGVSINVSATQYNEGDTFPIEFTTQENVSGSDLTITFNLANGGFNASDFSGITSVTIPQGQNSVTTNITLIDDNDDEGDEELIIQMNPLPDEYMKLNDNILIRVVDNDYTVAAWGTPLNPTYDQVESTVPANYYNSLDGTSGQGLRDALQAIIAEEGVVRAQTYADVYDILEEADQNPLNSNEMWLVYTEQGRPKLDRQMTSNNTGTWNREHVFPRSRGGYYSIGDDDIADGINVYWNTNADSLRHGNSDAHHLRAADGPENSSRGNKFYGQDEYIGPENTQGSFKGDVARSIFYMAIRYNGLSVVDGYPDGNVGEFGDLATLLEWHENDPPDDFEMNRNNVVYTWQKNRNPFIDQPELVDYIWGDQAGQTWEQDLSTPKNQLTEIKIFPNPTRGEINIVGVNNDYEVEIYSILGKKVFSKKATGAIKLNTNLSAGLYLVKVTNKHTSKVQKVIVK